MVRLSVGFTLKAVVGCLAAGIVVLLAVGAWTAWGRVVATNRIEAVAAGTHELFTILPLVRVDRVNTVRDLSVETVSGVAVEQATKTRAPVVPAILRAVDILEGQAYPNATRLRGDLAAEAKKLQQLMDETANAYRQPKTARRAGLADDYTRQSTRVLDLLNANTEAAGRWIKLEDSLIDKLFDVKAMAWNVRVTAGELGGLINLAVAGVAVPPDSVAQFDKAVAKTRGIWESAKGVLDGVTVDSRIAQAFDQGERAFLADEFLNPLRVALGKVVAGGKIDMTADSFNADVLPRLASLLQPANVALEVAIARAGDERRAASKSLTLFVGALVGALAIAVAAVVVIGRRIIRPLDTIRDRMMQLADGDLAVEVPFTTRGDEIGALGKTMATFKANMVEAERLRGARADEDKRIAQLRSTEMNALADQFDRAVGGIVNMVASAATELQTAAQTLTASAEETSAQSTSVAAASEQASANVASVASATEELSSSVTEISRQVAQSASITKKAVGEANQTTEQVRGLAFAADKIGSIVGLINNIAGQTNLLALNATIEAARAGEAGRGFAVVAAEVKQLADQTAKATADISTQIGAIQGATDQAATAIAAIGATIETMNAITTTIAQAVDSQGAATGEIARNVQEASRGTAEVSGSISGVTAAASESSAAASQVYVSASELSQQAETLRGEVAKFLSTVRAA